MALYVITEGKFIVDDGSEKGAGEQIELASDVAAQYASQLKLITEFSGTTGKTMDKPTAADAEPLS